MRKIQEVKETNEAIPFVDFAPFYENYEICMKGSYFPYNHVHEDEKWGCAWRSIQMLLSVNHIPISFKYMFELYGRKEKLLQILQQKKTNLNVEEVTNSKFAPQENQYNWAEPFIGQLICQDKNLKTQLVLVNGYPKCYAPQQAFEKVLVFKEFYAKLKERVPEQIVMIDDGAAALTIIGYKEYSADEIHLILGDPHISSNREDRRAGVYEVILGENGELKKSIVTEEKYYLFGTYKKIDFSNKNWMALFVHTQI